MQSNGIRSALADHLLTDLYTYTSEGLGYRLFEKPHREMCEFLESFLPPTPEKMAHATQKKGMLNAPRETLKTSLAQALIEYFLLKWKRKYNYDGRALLIRSSREASKQVLGAIREDFGGNNPVLLEAFGNLKPDGDSQLPWSADAITLKWRSTNYREPSIVTGGTESPQTGMHVDLIVTDDLANETNYDSARDMQRARIKIQSLDPVMNKWGSHVNIGTRWGHNDPSAFILDVNAALEARGKAPEWRTLIRGVYLEDGSLYYPDFLSEASIEQKRNSLEPKLFTAWYLNEVISDDSKVFRPEYLRFYEGDYRPDDADVAELAVTSGSAAGRPFPVRATLHIDPAVSVASSANFSGCAVVLTDGAIPERHFIHESWKVKEAPSALISRIVATAIMYRPQSISIDVLGQQVLWLNLLESALAKAGVVCQLVPYKGRTHDEKVGKGMLGKAKRIEALEPLFRGGSIFVRTGYNGALLNEYKFYSGPTHANHYDLLDALAHLRTMTRRPSAQRFVDDREALELAEFEEAMPERERRMVAGTRAGMGFRAPSVVS